MNTQASPPNAFAMRRRRANWYLADLDGLRGIAVLAVVLFHLNAPASSYGYLGVDIFMVLSGYLVCTRTTSAMDRGEFGALNFWRRRVKRLAPAAAATIFITVLASLLLDPQPLPDQVATQGLWSICGLANLHFWNFYGDYWGASAHDQPLLHMWSLAVEEQFYLVWPLALLFIAKAKDQRRVLTLLSGTLLSLMAFIILTLLSSKTAFYMAPTRAWQFGLGALVPYCRPRWTRPVACLAAVCLGVPSILSNSALDFAIPHVAASLTTVAILIHLDRGATYSILRSWPLATAGLRSYSIYLVHWPAIVMCRKWVEPPYSTALAILLTLAFSELSYRYIEKTVSARLQNTLRFIVVSLACAVVLGAIASNGRAAPLRSNYPAPEYVGWKLGRAPDKNSIRTLLQNGRGLGVNLDGQVSPPPRCDRKAMLIGDSLANMIAAETTEVLARYNIQLELWAAGGSDPADGILEILRESAPGYTGTQYKLFCNERRERLISGEIEGVVLVALEGPPNSARRMSDLVETIAQYVDWIVLVDSLPLPAIPHGVSMPSYLHTRGISSKDHLIRTSSTSRTFDQPRNPRCRIHEAHLSDKLTVSGMTRAVQSHCVLWIDNHHLSRQGVELCLPLIQSAIRQALAP